MSDPRPGSSLRMHYEYRIAGQVRCRVLHLGRPSVQPVEQSHIVEQTTKVLKVLADKKPLVLMLDALRGERHPLEKVLAEFKRYLGNFFVDLDQAEKDQALRFVDELLDSEPNRLGPSFRQAVVRHTGCRPLFAVELLRDTQEGGDLAQDAAGYWVVRSGASGLGKR